MRRIIRHASLALALLAWVGMSGCSTIKLAYNNSDELIYWWLDGYVDLQDIQKSYTREALSELQHWHRQQQLPEYIALLKRMQTLAPQNVTPAQVCAVTEDMKTSFVALLRHVELPTTQLAVQLNAEQQLHMREHFDKTNKDWRRDWLEPEADARLRYRIKQATNRLEDFYGHLEKPQREALYQWLSTSSFEPALTYAERERRQADILQTLQRIRQIGSATSQAQTLLHELIDRSFNSPNERLSSYNQKLWQDNCTGFAKLHNSTTAAQRERMTQTLKSYEADFRNLMTQK